MFFLSKGWWHLVAFIDHYTTVTGLVNIQPVEINSTFFRIKCLDADSIHRLLTRSLREKTDVLTIQVTTAG